jgi:hypothetical protein
MKHILCSIVILSGTCLTAFAQAPQAFNYQGMARATNGDPLENQNINVQFHLHAGSPTGTIVYEETHQATTNELGLFTLPIGQGDFPSSDFSAIDWGADSYYLQVMLDPAGGSSYQNMGTTQLLSVPYALYAASSGDGGASGPWQTTGNNISNTNTGAVGIGTSNIPAESKLVVGAMDGTTEGGQIQINAPGGSNNTAYFIDNYANRFRIMHGTNSGSTSSRLQIDGSGNVAISGGELQRSSTGEANMVPIAYGTVNSGGTLVTSSSSNNITATWNAGANRYEIAITGENFSLTSGYVTTVTPQQIPYQVGSLTAYRPTLANVRSALNTLYVIIYNAEDMSLNQAGFSFVVYKP